MSTASSLRTDSTRVTRSIVIAISLLALAIMAWKLSNVFTVVFGGVVGAAMLRALAKPLSRRTGWSETWSISLVILGLVVIAGGVGWMFGTQVAQQASEMQKLIPQAAHRLMESLDQSDLGKTVVATAKQGLADSKVLSGLGLAAGSMLAGVADLLLVFFLSIYFAYAPEEYLDGALRLLPVRRRAPVKAALLQAGDDLRRWLLAQFLAMAVVGVLVGIVMGLMGVPLAFLLGVLAMVLEFIPVVGAIVFTIPGVLLAFTKSGSLALYALLAYVAVQQVESNVIIPLLQRWAVRLPPALTLISVVVGGILFGVPGLVFASPLAVVVMSLVKSLYVEKTLEHGKPARA